METEVADEIDIIQNGWMNAEMEVMDLQSIFVEVGAQDEQEQEEGQAKESEKHQLRLPLQTITSMMMKLVKRQSRISITLSIELVNTVKQIKQMKRKRNRWAVDSNDSSSWPYQSLHVLHIGLFPGLFLSPLGLEKWLRE